MRFAAARLAELCHETPFRITAGRARRRAPHLSGSLSWVNEINALLTTAPCSPGFRPEHFAHTPMPPWRQRPRCSSGVGLVGGRRHVRREELVRRRAIVLKLTLALYVMSLVCGFFAPQRALHALEPLHLARRRGRELGYTLVSSGRHPCPAGAWPPSSRTSGGPTRRRRPQKLTTRTPVDSPRAGQMQFQPILAISPSKSRLSASESPQNRGGAHL